MREKLRELRRCTREKEAKAASSYRPVSLTNVAGQILKRIIARNLNDYLEANNMLNNCQHGGRRGRSTVTNPLVCESRIADFMNNNKPCDVITVDFMHACDKYATNFVQ